VAGNYTLVLSGAAGITDLVGNLLAAGTTAELFTVSTTSLSGSIGNDRYVLSTSNGSLLIEETLSGAAAHTYSVPLDQISSLRLDGGSGDDTLILNSALPFTPVFDAGTGNDAYQINAGSWSFSDDLSAASERLDLSIANAAVSFASSQQLQSLSIGAGGRVNLLPGGGRTLRATALDLSGNGTLDLADNDLILQGTEANRQEMLEAITAAIRSARNVSPRWSGNGITSSAAASKHIPYRIFSLTSHPTSTVSTRPNANAEKMISKPISILSQLRRSPASGWPPTSAVVSWMAAISAGISKG